MRMKLLGAAFAAIATLGAMPATAAVTWVDWTGQSIGASGQLINGAATVSGTVSGVGVTYSGDVWFAQTNGSGTNYWTPFPTTPPPGTDIITMNTGGLKTIQFSRQVTDVYLALNSWNGNRVTFDKVFSVEGIGCGYWGCGTIAVNGPSNGFTTASGEPHGVLKFAGPISSLSFTDTSEAWHGIQVGIGSISSAVPEPATWAMMIGGFGMVGGAMRVRRARKLAPA